MIEKYYTREQPNDLQRRERRLGAGTIRQTESEWSQLIAMLELAQHWQELIGEFTGEDAHPNTGVPISNVLAAPEVPPIGHS